MARTGNRKAILLDDVEHLLLSIIETTRVREILRACGADATRLRKELAEFIDQTTPRLKQDDDREVQPTLGFQRVLQRAVFRRAARKRSPSPTCWWRFSARRIRMPSISCRSRISRAWM
jgi:ATP-dependent Clp protease ATP-binding subunit ClpA